MNSIVVRSVRSSLFRYIKRERFCFRGHQSAAPASEYTESPNYPEILDLSKRAKIQRRKEEWHSFITSLPTVEQKLIELNMPRYYGYWSLRFNDNSFNVVSDDFCQYATRTHLEEGLPSHYYQEVTEEAKRTTTLVEEQVEQLIQLNFNTTLNRPDFGLGRKSDRKKAQNFLLGLHRILVGALESTQHIKDAIVDMRPRVEAFWFLGGIPPDELLKKIRRNCKYTAEMEDDLIDRPIQGKSRPFLGLRVSEGLPEVISWDDPLSTSASVPDNNLDPRAFGYKFGHKHATTVTGFWPGEQQEHSQLWLHTQEDMAKSALEFGDEAFQSALLQKMVISSFTQALAHATYLGFGPVTELTYPLVQQSAISDGQHWNLGVYQLNTCALHSHHAKDNPRNNILWFGKEEKLFEAVDNQGVKGLNTSLLTSLIAMYLKKGVPRQNPTPYLGPQKYLSEHPACEEYRVDFLKLFHHLLSNRPRGKARPEVYLWEKIYKVDNKTRPMEPPRRFFEPHFNQQSPGQRRLDDHKPPYIPKALRKEKKVKYKPKIDSEHLYKYD